MCRPHLFFSVSLELLLFAAIERAHSAGKRAATQGLPISAGNVVGHIARDLFRLV